MPEQFGDKRHEATPYRRQQAREHGQIPRSFDLVSALVLLVAAGSLWLWGAHPAQALHDYTAQQLRQPALTPIGVADALAWLAAAGNVAATVVLPWMLLVAVVAAFAHLVQTGLLFLPEKITPDWSHVDPLRGWQRIFSLSNVVRVLFGLLKIVVILAVAAVSLWTDQSRLLSAFALETPQLIAELSSLVLGTCVRISFVLLLLALLDYLFQYWKYEQDIRMTDQELREELRLLQGDPQIISRRRAIQRQLVMNRLSKIVPMADFVVTNPTEIAVAIRYDMETMPAPIVVAKGAGLLAQRIRRLALEHNVPIIERKALARVLYEQVEINQPIPVEQYAAVAEILRYVYQLKGKPLPRAA